METEQKIVKPCDPGWNDPPLFSYDSHTSQLKSEKRGNLLNKRVPFPLHSNKNASSTTSIDPTLPPQPCDLSSLPPPPSTSCVPNGKDISACSKKEANISDEVVDFDCEQTMKTTLKNFMDVLENKEDNEDLKEKASEIKRRLDIMEKMWKDDKFDVTIQLRLLQLSEAVKSGDTEKADHLQKCLMVDHASLCSSWMTGVRYILHSL